MDRLAGLAIASGNSKLKPNPNQQQCGKASHAGLTAKNGPLN